MAQDAAPDEYRPITVLSAVYRLWAKVRFDDCLMWQESWIDDNAWGCRRGRGADALTMAVAARLERDAAQGFQVGGIAYDFAKAFDLLPTQILFGAMERTGASQRILKPLRYMCDNLQRLFRLRGSCGPWWSSFNGVLQGDALSMIGLNAAVTVLLEFARVPEVVASSYADDVSATAAGRDGGCLRDGVRRFHQVVRAFESCDAGMVSVRKCFTFGSEVLQQVVVAEMDHKKEFAIVGGSFVVGSDMKGRTKQEEKRSEVWRATVGRLRRAPIHWKKRRHMLVAAQTQACYGQGARSFHLEVDVLKKMRSEVVRTLWQRDF